MMVALLRVRVDPELERPFRARLEETMRRAGEHEGFVSFREFVGGAGDELLFVVEFDSAEALAAWRNEAETLRVQQQGRDHFLSEYTLSVCREVRRTRFER